MMTKSKRLPYHKIRISIGTLEVTPPHLVGAIKLPHINYTRMSTFAFWALMPWWKEALV
jgi:hypothetical protein